MNRRQSRLTLHATLFPYTTLFRAALHYFGEIGDRLEVRVVAPKGGRRHQQMIFDKPGDGFRLRRSQAQPGAEVPRDIRAKHAVIAPASLCDVVKQDRDIKRSEEHTSELQSLMRISYAVFCLKKKNSNLHINVSRMMSFD